MTNRLLIGHALEELPGLPAGIAHQCVTSPPYWGLRDYKAPPMVWGGEPGCEHDFSINTEPRRNRWQAEIENCPKQKTNRGCITEADQGSFCSGCGAWRGQLGLEPTPELYVAHLVEIFREVKRVLRDDGTCWLNLGDSYASGGKSGEGEKRTASDKLHATAIDPSLICQRRAPVPIGLKPKDLVGIPWRVAFALQADGWYLRSDVIWNKPNPMPESVTDRPTRAHEYIFLLTKSARYYYDADAVREPNTEGTLGWLSSGPVQAKALGPKNILCRRDSNTEPYDNPAGRNLRSVWTFATQPYPEAHFATFPLELPMRCIRTSPPKVCAKCGAGWEQVVDKGLSGRSGNGVPQGEWSDRGVPRHRAAVRAGDSEVKTLGFRPTCTCYPPGEEETSPAVILDPFAGSGTTGEAAVKLGRDYILIEVNPNYRKLIENRTQGITAPLLPEAV